MQNSYFGRFRRHRRLTKLQHPDTWCKHPLCKHSVFFGKRKENFDHFYDKNMPRKKHHTLKTAHFGSASKRQALKMQKMREAKKRKPEEGDEVLDSDIEHEPRVSLVETDDVAADFREQIPESASSKKIRLVQEFNRTTNNYNDQDVFGQREWCLFDVGQLNRLLNDMTCPMCEDSSVQLFLDEKMGLSRTVVLKCKQCTYSKSENSSPRIFDSDRGDRPFDVNQRAVMFSMEAGGGYAVLNKFCAIFGMPNMSENTYQRIHKVACSVSRDTCDILQRNVHTIVKDTYNELHPRELDAVENFYHEDAELGCWEIDDGIPWIDVTFDGTWQRRGFVSHYGVGAVIEVITGFVIDWHVLSTYCHMCKLKENENLSEAQWNEWMDEHEAECQRNHHASAKAMERDAALFLWNNSVERTGFRYRTMLSDGDSAAFSAVERAKPYGDNRLVTKLECTNHVHKRIGTALRKFAKEEKLGGKGSGRLTLPKCKRLQNYFRGAILDPCNKTEDDLRNAVWATLFHSASTDEDPHHFRCPHGPDSWCFFNKALSLGQQPGPHAENLGTAVSREVFSKLVPLYKRMTSSHLLKRIMHKKTQNVNESFHSLLWTILPKNRFFGKRRVEAAVANAVGKFNQGNTHLTEMMNMFSMDVNEHTLAIVRQQDNTRLKKAEASSQEQFVIHRRRQRLQNQAAQAEQQAEEGPVYGPGLLADE
ncbi:uncharacterized protein LOC143282549 [Babylonia areolata]|uniref:uncharacterized protein LOC143282549 n=1 Tax=Babylonia areolata TaxID=304850 RepID=UPI003FCFF605